MNKRTRSESKLRNKTNNNLIRSNSISLNWTCGIASRKRRWNAKRRKKKQSISNSKRQKNSEGSNSKNSRTSGWNTINFYQNNNTKRNKKNNAQNVKSSNACFRLPNASNAK
jgi:hypothetical protein